MQLLAAAGKAACRSPSKLAINASPLSLASLTPLLCVQSSLVATTQNSTEHLKLPPHPARRPPTAMLASAAFICLALCTALLAAGAEPLAIGEWDPMCSVVTASPSRARLDPTGSMGSVADTYVRLLPRPHEGISPLPCPQQCLSSAGRSRKLLHCNQKCQRHCHR